MRESYSFNIDRQESGIPLSTAQDGAVDATKHKRQTVSVKLVVRYSKLLASSSPALQSSLLAG